MTSVAEQRVEKTVKTSGIILKSITKDFGAPTPAVINLDLEVRERELMVFLGPSGCGKSTTLYMIAGLEEPTAGEIYFGERLMNNVPPEQRDIAMVFQTFGLYPHMRARENIVFPLKLAKVAPEVIEERLTEITQMLNIDKLLKRRLNELSGGERQRIAIAKALVKHPRLYLLDEPFSNLDSEMRRQLRSELVSIHSKLKTTTVFVTHDQEEAMAIADRVAIMQAGELIQVGVPLDLYNRPRNMWVARFIGSHPINLIDFSIGETENEVCLFANGGVKTEVPSDFYETARRWSNGRELVLGIRPEFMKIHPEAAGRGQLQALVNTRQVLGNLILYELQVGSDLLRAVIPSNEDYQVGTEVSLTFVWTHILIFDKKTEQFLYN